MNSTIPIFKTSSRSKIPSVNVFLKMKSNVCTLHWYFGLLLLKLTRHSSDNTSLAAENLYWEKDKFLIAKNQVKDFYITFKRVATSNLLDNHWQKRSVNPFRETYSVSIEVFLITIHSSVLIQILDLERWNIFQVTNLKPKLSGLFESYVAVLVHGGMGSPNLCKHSPHFKLKLYLINMKDIATTFLKHILNDIRAVGNKSNHHFSSTIDR